jgi:TonB family protein
MKFLLLTLILSVRGIYCFAQNDTIYFDKDWKICNKENANYYRLSEKKGEAYIVTDYYMSNKPQMVAVCSSIVPEIKNGKCTRYYENGLKDCEGMYTNNKETGTWTWWDEDGMDSTIAEYRADGTRNFTRLSRGFKSENENGVYEMVDEMPMYPGGYNKMNEFIAAEFKLPKEDKKAGTKGTFYISFVVDENGNIINPVIKKSLSKTCDEEALRMVRKMPKWIPGKLNGRNVKVKVNIPIKIN